MQSKATPETHDPQSRVKSRIRGVEHACACVRPAFGGSNDEPLCGKGAVRERTAITRCAGNEREASPMNTDSSPMPGCSRPKTPNLFDGSRITNFADWPDKTIRYVKEHPSVARGRDAGGVIVFDDDTWCTHIAHNPGPCEDNTHIDLGADFGRSTNRIAIPMRVGVRS